MPRVAVCKVSDLPPGKRVVLPLGKFGIGVFNVAGTLYALANYCPHRGAPVCLGWLSGKATASGRGYQIIWEKEGEILRCPWHGWEFEIATGTSLLPPWRRIRRYPVLVEGDDIHVEVPPSYLRNADA